MENETESFKFACIKFGKLKREESKIKKEMDELRKAIIDFATENNLKGSIYGITLTQRLEFSKSNVKVANNNNIDIPYLTTIGLHESKVRKVFQNSSEPCNIKGCEVDMKELKKVLADKEIPAEFTVSYAIGLSKED